MSIAYHRRWYWKLLAVSYLCSFTSGWLLLDHAWKQGVPLFLAGLTLAIAAGRQAHLAQREAERM